MQIFVVSSDSDSFEGEEQEHRDQRRNRNASNTTRRENEEALHQWEEELERIERRNPRVAPDVLPQDRGTSTTTLP